MLSKDPNQRNKVRVAFIQPCIPHYRIDFFNRISKELDLSLYYGEEDHLGVKTFSKVEDAHNYNNHGYFKFGRCIFPRRFLELLASIKDNDVIVLFGNPYNLSNYILYFYGKLLNIKVVWYSQLLTSGTTQSKASKRLKLIKLFSDIFLTYTNKERKIAINYGVRSYSISNGINIDPINEILSCGSYNNPKGDNDKLNLIFLGRITSKSEILTLLQALKCMENVSLTVIGDGPCLEEARSYVNSNNLDDSVEFVGECMNETTIAKYSIRSDAFIYPGNIGLSLMHAFAYGLPAIIHDNVELHMPEVDIFKAGYNGLCFKKGSVENIVKTVDRLKEIKREGQLFSFSENAKKSVAEHHNTSAMSKNFISMINEIS